MSAPCLLLILDGFGHRAAKQYNAIALASTPTFDSLWEKHPSCLLQASGPAVGLPPGQMGNSEVGHLHLGAGRLLYQEPMRIDQAIQNGSFFQNPVLLDTVAHVKKHQGRLHLLGLLSPGGVHSHEEQLFALLKFCQQQGLSSQQVCIHAILDGRDTPPRSAHRSLKACMDQIETLGLGRIVDIMGRYYAMDRDTRWDRTELAYQAIVEGITPHTAPDPLSALEQAYARGESDEFIQPIRIQTDAEKNQTMAPADALIAFNYRADRMRQIMQKIMQNSALDPLVCASFTAYYPEQPFPMVFAPQAIVHTLGEYASQLGWRQLRLAETEKYAHVTFFFNGGREEPFAQEDRILIPSPAVSTYDQQPQMSAPALTEAFLTALEKNPGYDLIIMNFANADMLGHTGKLQESIAAIECLDTCLGTILQALEKIGGQALITADHGNAECLFDEESQQPHTAHTTEPVPLWYVGPHKRSFIHSHNRALGTGITGSLIDVAPTLLALLGQAPPAEMTGKNLLQPL